MAESGFGEILLRDGERQLGEIVAEWRELTASIAGSSYFQTPDWVLGWWEDRRRPETVLGLWRGAAGDLEAVAFLSKLREPLRHGSSVTIPVVTNSGSGRPHSADRCGWPVLPHRVPEVRDWVAAHCRGRSLLLRHFDHRSSGARCVPPGARRVLTTPCPVLEATDSESVAPRSKKLASDLRRHQRRLDEMGVTFTWIPPEQVTPAALDLLFSLHASSRSRRGGSSFTPDRHASFLRHLIATGRPGCGPVMTIASHNENPIGINLGFVWRDTFYGYQGGWDASYAKHRLGTVLKAETIRLAQMNGLRSIDFLRGTEPYKYSWGATDVADETWLLPRGASGWLLDRKYRLARADQARDLQPTNGVGRHTDANPVVDSGTMPSPADVGSH